ncbi:hypothetical protein FWK35_00000591 [Aphis craccivora]|uniref:Uncharacterized protein n=1 Tax=Aphis craccivora TaxID=307492 RepID=A0A6G0ZN95_APHCR|nr:hypothetical protein FWK35_00000591 [Aphis craccivora]
MIVNSTERNTPHDAFRFLEISIFGYLFSFNLTKLESIENLFILYLTIGSTLFFYKTGLLLQAKLNISTIIIATNSI